MIERKLERLATLGFNLLPTTEITTHYVLERGGFVALIERTDEGFGSAGSPGLVTDRGFAALIWRGDRAWFVARGFEQPATDEQVIAIRQFSRDLQDALGA